jgi:hypothetical protein
MKRLPQVALGAIVIAAVLAPPWILQAKPDEPVGPVKPVQVVNEPLLAQVQEPLEVFGTVDVGNIPDPVPVTGTVDIGNFPDPVDVQVVGQPVEVDVLEDVLKVSLFEGEVIAVGSNCIGPQGGLDLSGYSDYRLVLRVEGTAGDVFTINELYGPAGDIAQLNSDIDSGAVGPLGSRNYRHAFTVYGPEAFFIRIFNDSGNTGSMTVSGSLYAVK